MSESTCDAPASSNETALPVPSPERLLNGQFAPGHTNISPGRPKGARSRAALAVESLFADGAQDVGQKLLEAAQNGNVGAMKFCIDRVLPRLGARPADFELPPINSLSDVLDAHTALIEAATRGEVDSAQAKNLALMLDLKRKSLESIEFEGRVVAMEEHMTKALQFRGRAR